MSLPLAVLALVLRFLSAGSTPADSTPVALPNDNRVAAGVRVGDTLVLRLVAMPARWYIHTEREPAFAVLAFAEEGKTPTIPGPLLRVRAGTSVRAFVRNALADSLIVHGLGTRGDGVRDSLVVLPGATAEVRFVAGPPGAYFYWGVTTAGAAGAPAGRGARDPQLASGRTVIRRRGPASQLSSAYVVDPADGPAPHDRILVLTAIIDALRPDGTQPRDHAGFPAREFVAINGKSWPQTERLAAAVGDTLRWRVLNASATPHPMHLHGFYYRVDAHGDDGADADTLYAPSERRMVVTEVLFAGQTMSMAWSPDRPGGWLFHCHLTPHSVREAPLGHPELLDQPVEHDHAHPDAHAFTGMNGIVLATLVRGPMRARAPWRPARRLRLYVQTDSQPGDTLRRYGYVLARGREPRRDSVEYPGAPIVLTRGEATTIEIVNRADEPTAVHWHGIEIDNYYDGVVGLGRAGASTTPAIRPGATFAVHLTPKRAGTFMYHTHFDELRQQYGGLVGAVVVLEPGTRWDPAHDHVLVVTDKGSGNPRHLWINGAAAPETLALRVGETHRFRIANITVDAPAARFRLTHDSSRVAAFSPYAGDTLSWRNVAKDGWPVSAARARPRPGVWFVGTGETADFELTPDHPDRFAIEAFLVDTIRRAQMVYLRLPIRVVGTGPALAGEPSAPPAPREFDDCAGAGWCPRMVEVPAGRFVMGAPADEPGRSDLEGPPHEVHVRAFAAGKHDVTRGEWAAFVAATDRPTTRGCAWTARTRSEPDSLGSWRDVGFPQDDRHPVVCVTWDDARDYTRWLSARTGKRYRLLTEAEWEYAARAGTTTAYPWGTAATHDRANYGAEQCCSRLAVAGDRWEFTSPVDAFPPNAFGLHDMQGNVLQWVQDCLAPSYAGLPDDGSAYETDVELRRTGDLASLGGQRSCAFRMLRGGDYGDPPRMIRSAFRNFGPGPGMTLATYRSGGVGFRVARDLP